MTRKLALAGLVVSVLAAGAAFASVARAQTPPAAYYGGGLDAGDTVTVMIGDNSCGTATVGASGDWSITVWVGGCGGAAVAGATVTFAVNGAPAEQTATWRAGGTPENTVTGITLTVASPKPSASFGEVRISARRLADGRVEFALQPRSGGGWGEHVLPSSRYFPANAAMGRWLSSSPVDAGGAEARIGARRLADGRVEFVLQPRAGSGWGARVLPSSRYFPASTAVGRWLHSSPVALGGAAMTADAPATPACSLADHIGRVMAATFQVRTASGSGTAFYIGNDEWLTNHHVVEDATRAELVHGGVRLSAAVAGSLPGYDLALLRARPPSPVRPLRLAAARPTVLASVAVVGFPSGVSGTPSATRGVVSKHAPFSQFPDVLDGSGVVLQTDAEINPGNSGGPIVDGCGTVAAVATFKRSSSLDGRDVDGIGFGVAAETVAARLASLRSTAHAAGGAPQAAERYLILTAFCTYDPHEDLSQNECDDRSLHLDRSRDYWHVWASGVGDWDAVLYRLNKGTSFFKPEMWDRLRALSSGCHEIQAHENGVSTHWSEPYVFCTDSGAPPQARASVPATPRGLWLSKIDIGFAPDDLQLIWNGVAGADYYEVYHASDGEWHHEATVSSTNYRDYYPNVWYPDSYAVRACNAAGCSDFSAVVTEPER